VIVFIAAGMQLEPQSLRYMARCGSYFHSPSHLAAATGRPTAAAFSFLEGSFLCQVAGLTMSTEQQPEERLLGCPADQALAVKRPEGTLVYHVLRLFAAYSKTQKFFSLSHSMYILVVSTLQGAQKFSVAKGDVDRSPTALLFAGDGPASENSTWPRNQTGRSAKRAKLSAYRGVTRSKGRWLAQIVCDKKLTYAQ
jgi:hypothetical protein